MFIGERLDWDPMSRRIEIEITSLNGDVATWRAAGAKLPKGVLDSSLVPGGPIVGNVYRADIEQYMEGIEILSVTAPKTASPLDPRHERLEIIPSAKTGPDVVVTYAPKGRGGSRRDGADTRRDGGPSRREGGPVAVSPVPVVVNPVPVDARVAPPSPKDLSLVTRQRVRSARSDRRARPSTATPARRPASVPRADPAPIDPFAGRVHLERSVPRDRRSRP